MRMAICWRYERSVSFFADRSEMPFEYWNSSVDSSLCNGGRCRIEPSRKKKNGGGGGQRLTGQLLRTPRSRLQNSAV